MIKVGNYLSTIKNPQLKIKRILETARDLQIIFEEIENIEVIQQEDFDRQLKASNIKLLQTMNCLDQEVMLNNELTKMKHSLEARIGYLNEYIKQKEILLDKVLDDRARLRNYKYRKRNQFRRWLRHRLRKPKRKIPILHLLRKEKNKNDKGN